jgi:hypothetical protein
MMIFYLSFFCGIFFPFAKRRKKKERVGVKIKNPASNTNWTRGK